MTANYDLPLRPPFPCEKNKIIKRTMTKYGFHFFLLFVATVFTACQQNEKAKKITVNGTFTHTISKKIYLAELPFGSQHRTIVDSTNMDTAGKFLLQSFSKGEGIYQVFIEKGPGIMLINDVSTITIHADANNLMHYKVEGGTANANLQKMFANYLLADSAVLKQKITLDSILKKQLKTVVKDSLMKMATFEFDNDVIKMNRVAVTFINNENNGTAVYYALGITKKSMPETQWNALLQRSLDRFPHHPGLMLMNVSANSANKFDKQGLDLIEKPVVDILLPDTSGKNISISSFKGKWLLIDFWASWCAPCRQENPNLVAAFKQFNTKKFTILGISLDDKKENWLNAIRKDSLTWTQISDLKMWKSQAVTTYNFNGIPFNILVDPTGKVAAVNLRGDSLTKKLMEVLK